MESQSRDVKVTLGNKVYSLRTTLDAKELEQLQSFSNRLFETFDGIYDQERKLFLGWMLMAYELDRAERCLLRLLQLLRDSRADEEDLTGESGRSF